MYALEIHKMKLRGTSDMFYIILNPSSKSGRGIQIWEKLEPVFADRQIPYELHYSRHSGHIIQLVHDITEKAPGIVNIILLGGDGTLNEALQGVSDFSRVNFGYIPTGSSNDFARDMGLPKAPLDLLEGILQNAASENVTLLDLGVLTYVNQADCPVPCDSESVSSIKETVSTRYFSVSTGIGFDAAVCEEALSSPIKDVLNKLKLGKLTYLGIALKQLIQAKSIACDLILDNKTQIHLNRFLFVASMLHQYEGGGFKFCPDANATDGILDLCVVGKLPKPFILFALPTAFWGKHYVFPNITHYSANEIELHTSAPLWVHTDGEVHQKANHIKISCRKQTIRFLF